MYAILSDNGETLAVFCSSDQEEPEIMNMPEYVSAFGEDALSMIVNLAAIEEKQVTYNPIDIVSYLLCFYICSLSF